ncbi:hypothetical protein E6W36_06185 [Hankyongella ginsenosidimutans]|uniref:Molybdopterin dinucleotide-binding domain-containing protein n=1 Tax=Hankyongella ginsenosidimutans TaxID=1763828 RepID=A0A4D7C931_9SPHN|nr:hypothetical protein E6W36_06185 [Hankyongella ginsenosidimutans]
MPASPRTAGRGAPGRRQALRLGRWRIGARAQPRGASVFRVQVTDTQQRGALFAPMHWSDQFSAGGRTGRLPDQSVDPVSGQPGFKDSAAAIRPYPAAWQGFLVCRDLPVAMPQGYWTRIRVAGAG